MSEIIFAGDAAPATLSRAVERGKARRLARGVYTTDVRRELDRVVRSSWQEIVAHELPGSVVVDRSVAAPGFIDDGYLYLDTGPDGSVRTLSLPGLIVVARRGPGRLEDDLPLVSDGGLSASSIARGLADNARPTRTTKHRPRPTLGADEMADWIDALAADHGPDRLRAWRARAREISAEQGLTEEFESIDVLIGAALGTQQVATGSQHLRARQAGHAYDQAGVDRLRSLAGALRDRAPAPLPALAADADRRRLLPFFEAYFSNFIEGTEFEVDEATQIIFQKIDPPGRPADAHDIRATFEVVAGHDEMCRTPGDADELVDLLKERHARILGARPDKRPGHFKELRNRAGSVTFVAPELVSGTLHAGWDVLNELDDPFHRAVFLMFLVAEVHPFDDGNGRVARIMMNAELVAADETRIMVPTGLRSNYLSALTALSINDRPGPIIRTLEFAQRYTAQIDFSDEATATSLLEETNAFRTPDEIAQYDYRLILPSELRRLR